MTLIEIHEPQVGALESGQIIHLNRPWLRHLVDTAMDEAGTPAWMRPSLISVAEGARTVAAFGTVVCHIGCPAYQAGLATTGYSWSTTRHVRRFMDAFDETLVCTFDVDPSRDALLVVV